MARGAGAGNRRHHRSTNVSSASTAASAIGNEGPPVHIHGRPTVAEVSLAALRHNCRRVRELVGPGVAVLAAGEARAPGPGAAAGAAAFPHSASADAVDTAAARAQAARFAGAVEALAAAGIRPRHVHLANSAGVLAAPGAHFTMVRPGIMLYGYAPASHLAERAALRPAMRLSTAITQTRHVPAGAPVSYAGTLFTPRPSTSAPLPPRSPHRDPPLAPHPAPV